MSTEAIIDWTFYSDVLKTIVQHHDSVVQCTAGVIFLGVPFLGTDRRFCDVLPDLARVEEKNYIQSDILRYLDLDNEIVATVRKEFKAISNRKDGEQYRYAPPIVCCYEMKDTAVNKIVGHAKEHKVGNVRP
jgi:hypothetical protein